MAGTRVHELAKEFGMSSKELLVRLEEMKIPAKGHSATLVDAYVEKIRTQLAPELAEKAKADEEAKKAEAAAKAAAERKRREEEAAARAAAAEKERAAREAERAKNEPAKSEQAAGEQARGKLGAASANATHAAKATPPLSILEQIAAQTAQAAHAAQTTPAATATQGAQTGHTSGAKKATSASSASGAASAASATGAPATTTPTPLTQTQSQAQTQTQAARTEPQPEGAPTDSSASTSAGTQEQTGTLGTANAKQQPAAARGDTVKKPVSFSSLLSQIETESSRLAAEKSAKEEAKKSQGSASARKPKLAAGYNTPQGADLPAYPSDIAKTESATDDGSELDGRPGRKGKGRKGKDGGSEHGSDGEGRPSRSKSSRRSAGISEVAAFDDDDASEDDRYRRMALAAEQALRDKVIADAREAVTAANIESDGRRKKRKDKREKEAKEKAEAQAIERGLDPELVLDASVVEIPTGATVQEFADALGVPSGNVVKQLFMLGSPLTVTQTMPDDLIELIADDLERKIRVVSPEEEYAIQINDAAEDLLMRPPVVTVMGHVDHGKTSLLDAIRETEVIATEAGGITQHIGASVVHLGEKQITFIDTPGHEAFTAMRARGAAVTDVVVLVVAADDGVMPQTVEAIHHAKAAGVPIVVAVNKIDKPGATPERARQELTEHGIIPEEWGGQNMFVDVSAKQRLGIDDVLEAIILQADVLELKANPNALASGFVIEAKLDKGRGPIATVLVQRGTLKVGDTVVMGTAYGRVRALVNPLGEQVSEAYPSDPVEVLGLNTVPDAGDDFRVFAEERDARNLADDRSLRQRMAEQQSKTRVTLENFFSQIEQDKISELNLVAKADVQGSIEALKDALEKMDQSEVRINVIHSAVGGITETDITLASASDAVVIGFNVRPTVKAKQMADREKVEIKTYKVIYQAIEEINAARVGLLKPEIIEVATGMAEVRETFKVPKMGLIAGCLVAEGEVGRDDEIRIVRNGTVIHEGIIASLKHYKEDVKSVRAGSECGIGIEGYQDIKIGDILETFRKTEVARES